MQISIKPNTYIYLAVLLFLVPLPWLVAWMVTVIFHELCHWLAVKLCGGEVYQLTVGLGGANMECSILTDKKRLFSILSGPAGGFLLVLLGRFIPRTAICSWALSVYNLLPLLPLDGGRALQVLLRNDRTFSIVEKTFLILMTVFALYVAFILQFGALPLAIMVTLWLKNRKRPCK